MTDHESLDNLLGPEYARVARARKALEEAVAGTARMAADVADFAPMGTAELPAAVAALAASTTLDEDEDAARWVSRAFTAHPADLLKTGMDGTAFGGSVMMLRGALAELDQALTQLDPG
ncbi:hypothetical protein [Streptomyces violaceusniger]|uniref:Uncharacterized protein n=1 Tax=Streptomyces violaceusniger (strain Tu 4113) TaxID=653045 RepID=G2PI10_STRV4|nr:hypothetical protein [Streptomyces violaceusniger]AEM88961.1 hypothetical protein Strvi_0188 [Streptomyces violaceusniger Tu 4113]